MTELNRLALGWAIGIPIGLYIATTISHWLIDKNHPDVLSDVLKEQWRWIRSKCLW